MPVLPDRGYRPPFWLPGGDAQTMGPRLVCFIPRLPFIREQMELPDGDFLLVDWLYASGSPEERGEKLAVLSHGLEGDSTRSYMRALAIALVSRGWDVASRNFRGCGGPMNRLPVLYHSGETADLDTVVRHGVSLGYTRIALAGFSMGANQVLMYLGKHAASVPAQVARAAAVSVPCDLTGCSVALSKPRNRIYMEYFLRTLRKKMREKHAAFPGLFSIEGLDRIKTFKEFDDRFTAPLSGFSSAEDYWARASSLPYLDGITVPSLVVNAANDPFLSERCYPAAVAEQNRDLFLMVPRQGGHVGFPSFAGKTVGWLENTVAGFLDAAG